jgi:hypothetical protein
LMKSELQGPPCPRPTWNEGYEWKFLSNDKKASLKVVKKEMYNDTSVYRVENNIGRVLLINEDLGLVATFAADGNKEYEYLPPNKTFEWPLKVGNKWIAAGVMKTPTGSTNISTHYEVKDYGKIKTQGREYEAYYIVGKADTGARASEIWYSPEVKHKVKSISYTQTGILTEELLEYAHQAGATEKIDNTNMEKKLQTINNLRKKGIITEEEYIKKRKEILDHL